MDVFPFVLFWPLLFSVATCCPDLTLHPVRPSENLIYFFVWIYPARQRERDAGVTLAKAALGPPGVTVKGEQGAFEKKKRRGEGSRQT